MFVTPKRVRSSAVHCARSVSTMKGRFFGTLMRRSSGTTPFKPFDVHWPRPVDSAEASEIRSPNPLPKGGRITAPRSRPLPRHLASGRAGQHRGAGPSWLSIELLQHVIRQSVRKSSASGVGEKVYQWGQLLDVQDLGERLRTQTLWPPTSLNTSPRRPTDQGNWLIDSQVGVRSRPSSMNLTPDF